MTNTAQTDADVEGYVEPCTEPSNVESWRSSLLFGLVFFAIYVWSCGSSVQGGDSGEFATISALGGVPHPPGYPLFVILSQISNMLVPVGSVAFKAALASAGAGAVALVFVHRSVLRLTSSDVAAVTAAAGLGLSARFWQYSSVAEVFTLAAMSGAIICFVAVEISLGWRGRAVAVSLGVAMALSLAGHHSGAMLLPMVGYLLWWSSNDRRELAKSTAIFLGVTATGLLPYLIFMGDGGVWRWGHTETLSGLVHHILRADYGTFSLGISDANVGPLAHPWLYLKWLPREWTGFLAVLGVWGSWDLFAKSDKRIAWALAIGWLGTAVLFLGMFNLPSTGFYRVVAARFWLLPNTVFAVAVGVGVSIFVRHSVWSRKYLPWGILAGTMMVQVFPTINRVPHRGWTVLEDYVRNTLQAVEPNALIIGTGDSRLFGSLYAQEVLGDAPGVAWVVPNMVGYDWYREKLLARHPDITLSSDVTTMVNANVGIRPVYIAFSLATGLVLEAIPPVYPYKAVLFRVLAPEEDLPPLEQLERDHNEAAGSFVLRSGLESSWESTWTWEYEAWDQYGYSYLVLADLYSTAGDHQSARRLRGLVEGMSPHLQD